ncbi:MAG TPA: bifunctional (p)ppGpp synthetase/guanosine-3',5'-bis(diphosphate) 3'-pyrophosphohydrolase [Nitrospina sp.]|nr:bifunctional (p)ppGpp synthetase/guanosine-3',5'-bis(diphosphate) 3'-pyrophosphohydrolase [Nitrospinota bacterium]HAX46262.1 bifunctional (p)ppGpp synthetase/guanosine-3',5'-bis(diphosphate) 3'-pyrophosphohydrolase [Nitrospina sp.]
MKLEDVTEAVAKYHPGADLDIIWDAYIYSAKAHRHQSRRSGAAYISHPLEVAYNLTRLKMDEQTVAAGLLHDTIEDTLATAEELQEMFGEEVYHLVEGVTKISQIKFSSREESQAENYRKMILAMSKDIRVVLIKLADRAHNIKTLGSLGADAQGRIARETLDIFAPLANRLGIGWMKDELESSAFMYLMPDEHEALRAELASGQNLRDVYVKKVRVLLENELKDADIAGNVVGRSKHIYSIYKKMKQQKLDFKDLYDLIGVRVLTNSLKDCYAVLGLVHSLWKPIPGRFKDYVAMPKPNMYQSLHTTVIGPDGERVEIQIRTEEMHKICEEGIAAHWQYKEGGKSKNQPMDKQVTWVRHLLDTQKDLKNPREFLNSFKVDLFSSEVYVFTPEGDVISLQHGSTPVDFAYAVHTDIGDHCSAAKINGKIVPLRYKLKNGDQVEIKASKTQQPNRDWLSFVKTSKARSKILNFINTREKERSLSLGTELLHKGLAEYGVDPSAVLKGKPFDEALQASGFGNFESLLASIGLGKVSTHHFIDKLLPNEKIEARRLEESGQVKLKEKTPDHSGAIHLKCFNDDILLRVGKCCHAVPGDPIVGYITRGRGVTVHHLDCPSLQALESESERLVDVGWGKSVKELHPVRISIVADDKPGQLAEITQVMASCDINITQAHLRQGTNKRAYFEFFIEISDLDHLNRMFAAVDNIPGVIHAERIKEYNTSKKGTGKQRSDSQRGNPSKQDSNQETQFK